jgi:S-ribosylhomocysteine lyase
MTEAGTEMMKKKLIASFQVDHTKIGPGIYVSRRDRSGSGYITTFDIRMKRPNAEPAIHPNAMHTIEHVVATYLRNSEFKDHVVYWGPMGCLTGFYFIVDTAHEIMPAEVAGLIRRAFRYQANYRGEVPGATKVNCGNYLLHDIATAKYEARKFLGLEWKFEYPKAGRIKAGGKTFFDA